VLLSGMTASNAGTSKSGLAMPVRSAAKLNHDRTFDAGSSQAAQQCRRFQIQLNL
jgi:hypothetical protein